MSETTILLCAFWGTIAVCAAVLFEANPKIFLYPLAALNAAWMALIVTSCIIVMVAWYCIHRSMEWVTGGDDDHA